MPRLLAAILLVLVVLPSGAEAASSADSALDKTLRSAMSGAGGSSGAYVVDATEDRVLYRAKPDTPRILASNTKLFTTSAVLDELGPDATFQTTVLGDGVKEDDDPDRQPLPARRGRPDLRVRVVRAPLLRQRVRDGRGARRPDRRRRDQVGHRPRLRGRVGLRQAARRAGLELRDLDLGRSAVRAVVQPRARVGVGVVVPDEPRRVRGGALPGRAGEAQDQGPQVGPAGATPSDAVQLAEVKSPKLSKLV